MRLVLDTNTVISGLLWNGPPRKLLDAAISGNVELHTSAVLVTELRDVLAYPRFAQRLTVSNESVDRCVERYLSIAALTASATIDGAVIADPDDDHVIACALAAQADLIVSGDSHLLNLKHYQNIRIVKPAQALLIVGDG
ncbi:MAG: putative toxin-antitoxin system toxin component, PIN family [Betaproteobacteria bacterium]|nr:putative toxin-antitoxin system toxin component, PIN family [Betaproteobacteria bacterium]